MLGYRNITFSLNSTFVYLFLNSISNFLLVLVNAAPCLNLDIVNRYVYAVSQVQSDSNAAIFAYAFTRKQR